jgi:hypothetical protein
MSQSRTHRCVGKLLLLALAVKHEADACNPARGLAKVLAELDLGHRHGQAVDKKRVRRVGLPVRRRRRFARTCRSRRRVRRRGRGRLSWRRRAGRSAVLGALGRRRCRCRLALLVLLLLLLLLVAVASGERLQLNLWSTAVRSRCGRWRLRLTADRRLAALGPVRLLLLGRRCRRGIVGSTRGREALGRGRRSRRTRRGGWRCRCRRARLRGSDRSRSSGLLDNGRSRTAMRKVET